MGLPTPADGQGKWVGETARVAGGPATRIERETAEQSTDHAPTGQDAEAVLGHVPLDVLDLIDATLHTHTGGVVLVVRVLHVLWQQEETEHGLLGAGGLEVNGRQHLLASVWVLAASVWVHYLHPMIPPPTHPPLAGAAGPMDDEGDNLLGDDVCCRRLHRHGPSTLWWTSDRACWMA